MHAARSSDVRSSSTRKLTALMVLGTLAVVLLLSLAAEGAIRLRQYVKYGSTATLEEQFTVDQNIRLRIPVAGFSRGNVSVNQLGFRGDEITIAKPANTLRLAFLGASTTWCAEVSSDRHVWPHLVADILRKVHPRNQVDYVNAGVPGYTIESMLSSLKGRVAPLSPDVIVIYEASNNLTGEMRRLAAQRGIIASDRFQDLSWPSRYSVLWHLAEKNLKVLAAERTAQQPQSRLDVDVRSLGEPYRAALVEVVREAQRHAKVVALVTFSIQPRRDQTEQQKLQASSSALYYMPFLHPDTVIAAFERYNEIVREVALETGAILIGGEHDIPGDMAHFNDSVHFTDAGSAAMAKRVASALLASDRIKAIVEMAALGRVQ